MRRVCRAASALMGAGVVVAVAGAGDLDPPAGPIAPTPGPEPRTAISDANTPGDANSVYRIEEAGSYYLTENLIGEAGKHGIEIAASGVTVDLMGFALVGQAGTLNGMSIGDAGLSDIEVRNGSTRLWDVDGIDLTSSLATNLRIIDVRASKNGVHGIAVGTGSVVTGCVSNGNGSVGLLLGGYSVATECTAHSNLSTGISGSFGNVVESCTTRSNGTTGITAGQGSTVRGCTATLNSTDGIVAGSGCTVVDCSATSNGDDGIVLVGGGNVVTDCTSTSNTGDGIEVQSGSVVTGNVCASNGLGDGANIHATSVDNRIEGNTCVGADRGIEVDVAGSIIVGNTSSGALVNWDIEAGNVVGPIEFGATNAVAIEGSTYAGSTGSTDPNANYTY